MICAEASWHINDPSIIKHCHGGLLQGNNWTGLSGRGYTFQEVSQVAINGNTLKVNPTHPGINLQCKTQEKTSKGLHVYCFKPWTH